MAWVGQQDWPKLCVRRTTGQIFPRTLTRHQLTHLFASAMLAEEMEEFDEEEKLRKKAEKMKKEKEKELKMKMKWTSKLEGGKVEKISAVEAEVMETDGDSEDFDDNDEDDGEVFEDDDDFDDDDDEEENSSDHESFLTV